MTDPTNVEGSHGYDELGNFLVKMQIGSRAGKYSITMKRCQQRHAEMQATHGRWREVVHDGLCECWELPVGPCVEATRFPRYGKWLQRERRMVSEGVGARIHRQPCIAGGDFVLEGIARLEGLGRLVQFLGLH